jgi:drug/metabolite transporter (DMT)-like permease
MSAPDPIEPLSPMVVGPSSRRIQAIGAVMYLIAAFLFALNGSVAKAQIEAGLSPAEVTEIRTIGCALLLLIYILIVNPGSLKVRRTEIPFSCSLASWRTRSHPSSSF